ncbi:hypothetical protein ACFPOI_09275 [Nonomuraea angiospora]|uniref:Uncharacterized protein n=1 Tax=Nonomuraea angiospora TaxID=46172 RepID=A0ABR9MB38_9ACTN|nr:hypothetical protein [Nonomuraea angiospora]MBE1589556.1 hypothetical protein [Nonomuraea angiospora]
MNLLTLGAVHHVGRALVDVSLERGDEVATLNRGPSRTHAVGVAVPPQPQRHPASGTLATAIRLAATGIRMATTFVDLESLS